MLHQRKSVFWKWFFECLLIYFICAWNLWDWWTKSQMHKFVCYQSEVSLQMAALNFTVEMLFQKPPHDFQTHILYRIVLCALIHCETFVTPIKRHRMNSYTSNQLLTALFLFFYFCCDDWYLQYFSWCTQRWCCWFPRWCKRTHRTLVVGCH